MTRMLEIPSKPKSAHRNVAAALGRLFTIAANFLDPDAYFIGGGVVETRGAFKTWFLQKVRDSTTLREEEAAVAGFELVRSKAELEKALAEEGLNTLI